MPNLRFSYSAGASFLAAGGSGSLHTPPVQTTLGFFASGGGVAGIEGASLGFPGCSCACAAAKAPRKANVIRVFVIRVSAGVSGAGVHPRTRSFHPAFKQPKYVRWQNKVRWWHHGGMRLLVVEDNHSLAESVAKLFRAKGYAVDTVETGDDARTALQTQPYDV